MRIYSAIEITEKVEEDKMDAECLFVLLADVKQIRAAERERCAMLSDEMVLYTGVDVAEAIRAMGDSLEGE